MACAQFDEMAGHVLSRSGALAENSGEAFSGSRGGNDSLSRHHSVVADGGSATTKVPHDVAMLARVCLMASRVS